MILLCNYIHQYCLVFFKTNAGLERDEFKYLQLISSQKLETNTGNDAFFNSLLLNVTND